MDAHHRMPLHDIPLELFISPTVSFPTKTPRKHKRPLSPSQSAPLNPAKRRVLDTDAVPSSSSLSVPFRLTVTPTRPSRLGNGPTYNSQTTTSPALSTRRGSPSREPYPKPAIESSTDPQSRHYPGFDIFRDYERRGSSVSSVATDDDAPIDKPEEDKENVPPKRKAKKPCAKKRLLIGLDGLDTSRLATSTPMNRAVRGERSPFSACQALR